MKAIQIAIRLRTILSVATMAFVLLAPRAVAQAARPTHELRAAAEKRQTDGDWAGAIEAYRRIVALDDKDKVAWFELARCALELPDLSTAVDASRRAAQLGGRTGLKARLLLSRALARSSKNDAALSELDRALEQAPADIRKQFLEEAGDAIEFDALRQDARFARVLSKSRPDVVLPPELSDAAMGWAYWEEAWVKPDPTVVTNAQLRSAIESTGLPWRVRDRLFHIEFVLVPPGTCIQGTDTYPTPDRGRPQPMAPNNTPRHKVTISKALYLARFELSVPEWNRVTGKEPSPPRLEQPLAEELAKTVLASVTQAHSVVLTAEDAKQLALSIDSTVEDSLRKNAANGDLRSPQSNGWWASLAESITDAVAQFTDRRPAPPSDSAGGRPAPAPGAKSPEDRRQVIAKAVADGITKFVHERGCIDAYPKHWLKCHNDLDDRSSEAWQGAREVLTRTAPLGLRLPTEAEWEYAVRVAGIPIGMTNLETYRDSFRAVDQAPPADGLGLFNMVGSAAEWCSDYYIGDAYSFLDRESTDPVQVAPAAVHCAQHFVLRGSRLPEVRDTGCKQARSLHLELIAIRLARSVGTNAPSVPYVHPQVAEFDAPSIPMEWATTLDELPDPQFVTDARLREAIVATGLSWRVKDKSTGVELLLVPPGTYKIGHPYTMKDFETGEEATGDIDTPLEFLRLHEAAREVTVKQPFYLARVEQPFQLWNHAQPGSDARLDLAAGLRDAERTIKAQGFRLPTDVEWEVACRAGTTGHFYGPLEEISWRDCPDSVMCWHNQLERKPNPLGFYAMIGSRSEPCIVAKDPVRRVYRGGECHQAVWQCAAWSTSDKPQNMTCGLRVARNP